MATASQLFIPPTTTSKVPPKSTLAKLKAQERRTHATAAMSKSEIQSWISSSAVDKEDRDDSATSHPWQRDQVLNDWPSSVDYARTVLLTHRTKDRIAFLREELLSLVRHADLSLSQIMDIFQLLSLTFSKYTDTKSQSAVEEVGLEFLRRDEARTVESENEPKLGVSEQIVSWISTEVGKMAKRANSDAYAPADILVLLTWSCNLYTVCSRHNSHISSSNIWKPIIGVQALLIDIMLESSQPKPALRKAALVRLRRALRSSPTNLPHVISTILGLLKASNTPTRFVPLLGISVDVLIRLKNTDTPTVERLSQELKDSILAAYTTNVFMSKSVVPPHILSALNDFIATFVTPDDLAKTVLPSIEKALLRSPEYSLPAIISFFSAYPHALSEEAFKKFLTQAINNSKSSNPTVRINSIQLFQELMSQKSSSDVTALARLAVPEILSLPKAGKTAGPDHRVALYSMLASLIPAEGVSEPVLQTATALLAKESHEAATAVLASALSPHIRFLLSRSVLPSEVAPLIAKEMGSSKPAVRRAFCSLAGSVFFAGSDDAAGASALLETTSGASFAEAVFPGFEAALKAVASNPINANPFEGYIAIAVLLGPVSGKFGSVVSQNAIISAIPNPGPKHSFVVWDKVFQKVVDEEDQLWLLRAAIASLQYFTKELENNEYLRTALGSIFLHLAVDGQTPDIRRQVNASVAEQADRNPVLINRILREALRSFLSKGPPAPLKVSQEEGADQTWNKHARVSSLLFSGVSFKDDVDKPTRHQIVSDLVVLTHHSLVSGNDRQTWIEVCQKASLDPQELVNAQVEKLVQLLLADEDEFSDASHSALTTLVFVSPSVVLHCVMEQLRLDLDASAVNTLSDFDFGVWATPEGTAYVNVLSANTNDDRLHKGKDSEIAKWEADLRKSLANKKPATAILTKQQQAAVAAQLATESKVRANVQRVRSNLLRGLAWVRAAVQSGVSEFSEYMSGCVEFILKAFLGRGTLLVGPLAFETYIELSNATSDRLDNIKKWVGVATLRLLELGTIPEELQAEPLHMLVIRVLYRLRFLSEQSPFDPATFSYAFPLLHHILSIGGVPGENEEDDPLEQVALILDIIKFHSGEFSGTAFPRLKTTVILIDTIRTQPKLAKESSSALIGLGDSLCQTATTEETQALIQGTLAQESHVRNSCLQTLQPFDLTEMDWIPLLWTACHDDDEQNSRLARHLWEDNGLDVPENFLNDLLPFLGHENMYVRLSTAAAIAEAVAQWPQTIVSTLQVLQDDYREKAKVLAPEFDQYGMVIAQSLDRADPWPARSSIAKTFELLAESFTEATLEPFFKFLIHDQALGDREGDVRRRMLAAGTAVIDLHGDKRLAALISLFEGHLAQPTSGSEADDQIKEAVVILFGRVARHLQPSDPRIPVIVDRLVDTLKTPAEQVQIAISECLSPLVQLMRPRLSSLVDSLFQDLTDGNKYAVRRGAAYGLAGVIKGAGIGGMKEFDVIRRLKIAADEKKRFEPRQGVMFAFETLTSTLGRLFEPYVTHILHLLLTAFGDTVADVRDAAQDAAKVIMGSLSGYGVKLIMPTLLEGLDEKQWRSKKGSIELLGMMAFCSPRQLSISLPIVIPRLTGVLTDSHAQVRAAANKSLKQFGEVISNPEIQSLVPVLLKALVDPAKTANALQALIKTSFMHYIDHSSLAIVIPIIERGLRERSADIKKKAAQIVGNLASLTDSKDFVPYLDELMPMVHNVLIDPVPEARATAAKALGTLVERLGEIHFPDLVPSLLRTLKTNTSAVDRQGAAQGLSEVLSGLGMERMEALLPDVIANARSPRATVREGFMSLLVFLPATFGTRFQPHLPKIIPPILSGLADAEEFVRDAAMKAGRMVVNNYSNKAIDLLLPELERGMVDSGWRIRQSSITLVGELLFKVSGISGKLLDLDEEDVGVSTAAEGSRKALGEVLGTERRDRILAALYLVRQDSVVVVRQSSMQIWKVLVNNTPRTVREILPELIEQILVLISSDEDEQQETASRTVGEICRKFGERILGEIIPLLKTKSTSPDARTREAVSLVIAQIMQAATESQREDYEDDIVAIVRGALVDDEANVRTAGAQAFDVLQDGMGPKAIDQTIPTLLEALRQPGKSSGTALQALKEVMSVRAPTVFPVLIPTLTAIPMTIFNAHALASLVSVAGSALSRRLSSILTPLVKVSEDNIDEELREAVDEAFTSLLSAISDAEGLNTLMMVLLGWAKGDSPKRRVSSCELFAQFCEVSDLDHSIYRVDWIRQLVTLLDDPEVEVHTAAWAAFEVFVKSVPKDELEPLVVPLRRTIESTGAPGRTVPGLDLPKGASPFVPIIIAGLTTGSNEQREQAAYAIGDLVERTSESAIKPFVVPFTGPLIRVATQATTYPPAVKTGILSALTTMLEIIPAFVKPFFPQLQRTFVKSTSDPASVGVRAKAGQALGVLMKHQPRVDPVITELVAGVKTSPDSSIATSFILALAHVITSGGANVGEKAKEAAVEVVIEAFRESHSEHYAEAVGKLMVALSDTPELLRPVIESNLVGGTPPSTLSSHVILTILIPDDDEEYSSEPNLFQKLGLLRKVAQKVNESAGNDKHFVARPAREARDFLKKMEDESLAGLF